MQSKLKFINAVNCESKNLHNILGNIFPGREKTLQIQRYIFVILALLQLIALPVNFSSYLEEEKSLLSKNSSFLVQLMVN